MTIEEAFRNIEARGFRFNSLVQIHAGRWWADVTKGKIKSNFGRGNTPAEAIVNAADRFDRESDEDRGRNVDIIV